MAAGQDRGDRAQLPRPHPRDGHGAPRAELGDPHALALRTRVNGELVQDSSTAEVLFGVAALLAYCSRAFTLERGDLLLTGTPWGCGEFMEPRRSLAPGDVVEAEVEGIGTLRNPLRAAP